ncbi:MAG: MotA/TolQ/ExbB proton channel family protein [Deltaproteobacteria bacterium]|nr:MAG: MotA/TolQ/ExbB proton channel family protein [Deltaproteobacteria bacterium]
MVDLLAKGGPLVVPIVLGSVVGLGVLLERLWSLRRARVAPPGLGPAVRERVRDGDLEGAMRLAELSETALGRVLSAGLSEAGAPRSEIRERVEEVGRREAAHLERYVGVLGVVAAIEPLLGLLGTVTGMIDVFQRVVDEGVGDPKILASGIWEALITTAAGLTVAIPAYLAWRYLLARVRDLVLELEEEASLLADLVCEGSVCSGRGRAATADAEPPEAAGPTPTKEAAR